MTIPRLLFFAGVLACGGAPLQAQGFLFTFDSLPPGQTMPLAGVAPEVGGPGLTATFTTAPLADYLWVGNYNTPGLISGQQLLWNPAYSANGIPPSDLTITFSRPSSRSASCWKSSPGRAESPRPPTPATCSASPRPAPTIPALPR